MANPVSVESNKHQKESISFFGMKSVRLFLCFRWRFAKAAPLDAYGPDNVTRETKNGGWWTRPEISSQVHEP